MKSNGLLWVLSAPLLFVSAACASTATQPAEARSEPRSKYGLTAEQDAQVNACYSAALPRHPGLAVNTVATVIGRGEKVLLADVMVPEAPELARCIVDKLVSSMVARPSGDPDDFVWIGGTRIALGRPVPIAPPPLQGLKERSERLVLEGRRRGLLRDSDRIVQEVLHPQPPWPTAEQTAELDACYRAALHDHPGLIVHAHALYIGTGTKILIADVPTPEAPALGQCLAEKMVTWRPPFSEGRDETRVSGFFVHLGAAPEFPEQGEDPSLRLGKLVSEAARRGLITETDPLLAMANVRSAPVSDAGANSR